METKRATAPARSAEISAQETLVRQVLQRIADKWTLLVLDALEGKGHVRFTDIQRHIGGVSQKMLTKTLRQLERDGLVTRRVHAEVPPRVDYKLTRLGERLGESVCGVWQWVERHASDVERSRGLYDTARARG